MAAPDRQARRRSRPDRRHHDVLLHDRATAVRSDLFEIAALLERSRSGI